MNTNKLTSFAASSRSNTRFFIAAIVLCFAACGDDDGVGPGPGPNPGPQTLCSDTCGPTGEPGAWAGDGECDDGGDGSTNRSCALGTDCMDCGERVMGALDCGAERRQSGGESGGSCTPVRCSCGSGTSVSTASRLNGVCLGAEDACEEACAEDRGWACAEDEPPPPPADAGTDMRQACSCDGRECGDDGCGTSCGSCEGGEACSRGTCVCAPNCDGRSCGDDDGCGGICTGGCASDEECVLASGSCQPRAGACYYECSGGGQLCIEATSTCGTAPIQSCATLGAGLGGRLVREEFNRGCNCDEASCNPDWFEG